MNVKRFFWRFWVGNKKWAKGKLFWAYFELDMVSGVMYAGVTVFGYSFLYSDVW